MSMPIYTRVYNSYIVPMLYLFYTFPYANVCLWNAWDPLYTDTLTHTQKHPSIHTQYNMITKMYPLLVYALIEFRQIFIYIDFKCIHTICIMLLSTHSLDPCLWGESDNPTFGPPASNLSIWPAAPSLQRGLSTNPGVTVWCVCGCS